MQLCLSAEAAGRLARALSHVNRAVGMYSILCSGLYIYFCHQTIYLIYCPLLACHLIGQVSAGLQLWPCITGYFKFCFTDV